MSRSFSKSVSFSNDEAFHRPWPSQSSAADLLLPAPPPTARSRAQVDAFEQGLAEELSRRHHQARQRAAECPCPAPHQKCLPAFASRTTSLPPRRGV